MREREEERVRERERQQKNKIHRETEREQYRHRHLLESSEELSSLESSSSSLEFTSLGTLLFAGGTLLFAGGNLLFAGGNLLTGLSLALGSAQASSGALTRGLLSSSMLNNGLLFVSNVGSLKLSGKPPSLDTGSLKLSRELSSSPPYRRGMASPVPSKATGYILYT